MIVRFIVRIEEPEDVAFIDRYNGPAGHDLRGQTQLNEEIMQRVVLTGGGASPLGDNSLRATVAGPPVGHISNQGETKAGSSLVFESINFL